ncbi:DUF4352 domain-containing protein [Fictibacillus phosphorivorans]|uniref:DUF4352 domain-containing protein n=1 Tax=Fictibacillus phosphorivorans TaxID=1221500 RepID=UPI0020414981|nr:DUF4352 domain-containing protein [Fictibacillus phosphorivorans]MCM3777784.1 DUF4352 domain-containing protein [Fictibacillus phosphorivorans]
MSIKKWTLLVLTAAIITGCSTDRAEKTKQKSTEQNNSDELKFKDSPQASDDTKLTKVNESVEDPDGMVTLKKYKKIDEEQKADLISLTVSEVKVMQYRPSVDLIDFFHGYTDKEEFPYIRVNVRVKNNGKKPVHFAPVSEIKTDQGEKVTWENDFYLEKLNGKIKPGEVKVGSLGFILNETKPEDVKTVIIKSSEVLNKDKKKIAEPLSFNVHFE